MLTLPLINKIGLNIKPTRESNQFLSREFILIKITLKGGMFNGTISSSCLLIKNGTTNQYHYMVSENPCPFLLYLHPPVPSILAKHQSLLFWCTSTLIRDEGRRRNNWTNNKCFSFQFDTDYIWYGVPAILIYIWLCKPQSEIDKLKLQNGKRKFLL